MTESWKWFVRGAAFAMVGTSTSLLWAVTANPLETAYWRFEEATSGPVSPPEGDVVADSALNPGIPANHNPLRPPATADTAVAAPSYTGEHALAPLKSGIVNTAAMSYLPNNELVASGKNIENGIIAAGHGFTIEAAFRSNDVTISPSSPYQSIIVKDGQPADDGVGPPAGNENLPTLTLKIRGDSGKLQFEEFDGAKQLKSVSSSTFLNSNQWYNAAVVNTGSLMQLYLDSNDGNGYILQSSVAVSGALYQTSKSGPTIGQPDWTATVAVGRGNYNGRTDWFNGIIDEVRFSNTALDPSRFLFAPGSPADYNNDGVVDAADYVLWRKGPIAVGEFESFRAHFGPTSGSGAGGGLADGSAVPEAASGMLLVIAAVLVCFGRTAISYRRSLTGG